MVMMAASTHTAIAHHHCSQHVCNSLSQQGPLTLDKLVTACNKGVAPGTGASLCGVGTAAVLAARGPGTTAKTSTARFDEPGAARRAVGLLSHSQVAEALIALITHDVVGVSCAPRRSEAEAANAAAKIAAKEAAARHRKAKSRGFDPTSASGGALGAGSISRAATAALKTSALRQLPRTGAVLYTFQVMETLRRLQFARIITLAAQLFGQEVLLVGHRSQSVSLSWRDADQPHCVCVFARVNT